MGHTADLVQGIPGNYVFEVLQSSGFYLAGWFRETLGDPKLLGARAPALDEAVKEMSILGTSQGANEMTAFGLPGVGDLEVTGLSGRNKFYGVRIEGVSDSWLGRR